MIQVKGLSKRYANTVAVDDISFDISKGEVVGLLGPNGAGKSTTMKILTCYLSATAGSASINGYDVFDHTFEVRQHIGYVPENNPLYPDLEVETYLNFIAEIRGIDASKRKQAVDRVVHDCSLEQVLHKVIGHLSKGYRQRVGLAQALIHDPQILILDEPTSGLDPNQIRDILNLINNLGKEKTVIHSTHILSEVEATSDRVLIINNGKIVAQGTPQELTTKAAGTTVFVTMKGENVSEELKQLPVVKNVSSLGVLEAGFEKFGIHAVDNKDIAVEVYKQAVEKGWIIKELRTESARLEDVFTKLTRG